MNISGDESSDAEDETEPRSETPTAKKGKKAPSQEQPFMDNWLQLRSSTNGS